MALVLHVSAAIYALVVGLIQLATTKGSQTHRFLGWTWVLAMLTVAFSSFGLKGLSSNFGGYSLIHILSIWIIISVTAAVWAVRQNKITTHRRFATGALFGLIGAGIGTLMPGRLFHQLIFAG